MAEGSELSTTSQLPSQILLVRWARRQFWNHFRTLAIPNDRQCVFDRPSTLGGRKVQAMDPVKDSRIAESDAEPNDSKCGNAREWLGRLARLQ
jgi:hypothetical protein